MRAFLFNVLKLLPYRILLFVSYKFMCESFAAACDSNGPLGLITGAVEDWQITASSTYPSNWEAGCQARYARVYQPNALAWCAKHKSSSEWLQVDLGVPAKVCMLWLRGRVSDLQSGGCRFESRPGLLLTKVYILPSIHPGSVNEYQLELGRLRQVWLISTADERVCVQIKL